MKLKIKEYRKEMQLSQRELAEKIETTQRNISNWENGDFEPDCEAILRLADTLDITIDELFGREPFNQKDQKAKGIDYTILQILNGLSETQKLTLLQFLREITNSH